MRRSVSLKLSAVGRHRLPGVAVDQRTAELAGRLAGELGVRVLLGPHPAGTALYLPGPDGRPLRNHFGGRETGRRGRPLEPAWPIMVALVGDPSGDSPVSVFLEPVPGTSVGYAGDRRDTVEDAVQHIVRHYRPALDPAVGPWRSDTPWRPAAGAAGDG